MPLREIIGKAIGFGLTAGACIAGGILAFYGPHPYNDYVNTWLAIALVALGLIIGGVGTLMILGIVLDARARQKEESLHITPRPGPLGPPPPWHMGEVGRPGTEQGVVTVGDQKPSSGGGGIRVMSVSVSNIDGPIVIGLLLLWTVGMLIWLAPR